VAVEIVSGNDSGTALGILVSGAVVGIVATLDASARTTGFDELDVVLVTQADAVLGVPPSTCTSARVLLTSCVARVQPTEFLRTDAPSNCGSKNGISHRGAGKDSVKGVTHVGRNVLHQVHFRF